MAPRRDFFLIFSENPPAADVVREDFLVSKEATGKCVFRWVKNVKKDPEGEQVSGKIVRQGKHRNPVCHK
jgi:hypothetical protein